MARNDETEVGELPPVSIESASDALNAAIDAARIAEPKLDAGDGREFAFVPRDWELKDITSLERLPASIHQSITLDNANSLITYANRFSDARSIIIADIDNLAISARLDWHNSNQGDNELKPQPVKHMAILRLRESEEFKRWNEMQNKMHDQMVFAEFLDENASDIIDPDPADMIEIARELEATQGVAFKAATRLQTGERSIRYETETHVKGELKVPTKFRLSIPIFQGEEPAELEASFRFRPSAEGLKLGFVWRRVEYRRQADFAQIATRVSEETGLPQMFGRTG